MLKTSTLTAEQQARDLLERLGVANAQSFSAGDVVELANLIAERHVLLAALKALINNTAVQCVWDEGPENEGWKSDELATLFANAEAAIVRAEGRL